MIENCKVKTNVGKGNRWNLVVEEDPIEIGLEATTRMMKYMAFRWANPNATGSKLMVDANVGSNGFRSKIQISSSTFECWICLCIGMFN